MNLKKYLLVSIFTLSFFIIGCDNNENNLIQQNDSGVLQISLTGTSLNELRASGTQSAGENDILNYIVYIFNDSTNFLEKVHAVPDGATTTTLTGLSTGSAKKIVVIANTGNRFPTLTEGDSYQDLEGKIHSIDIATLDPDYIKNNGLVMKGESSNPVTITASGTNNVSVELNRIAAKIIVGDLTLAKKVIDLGYELEQFSIDGVSIQRAITKTDIFGQPIDNPIELSGGWISSMSTTSHPFLKTENFEYKYNVTGISGDGSYTENIGEHFYVLPNSIANSCTMVTYRANYGDKTYYFPIKINNQNDGLSTNGNFIQSNYSYTLNLTIKDNLTEGSTNPDLPQADTDFNLEISVKDWEVIVQNEAW